MPEVTEIEREQRVIDSFYARLDDLRSAVKRRLAAVRRVGPSGSPQNRSERDAFASMYEDRAAQLDAIEDRLSFGRLDFDDDSVRYIGRIGLTDDNHRQLLTDWRAPAAEPFYQATARHRTGVWRRRHLTTKGRRVTAIEDDLLDIDRNSGDYLSGEGALMAALAKGRTAKMHDIVSTIQSEQDRVIRAPLAGAVVVQGGPGTGKTAVALHRAAYLLYAHRSRLERSGVLLIGPSSSFLKYIDQVLPSLGETGVVATTMSGLLPQVDVTAADTATAAAIKGDRRWVDALARAVRARQRVPEQDIPIEVDGRRLVISRTDVAESIARARRSHKPHNEARLAFVREMLRRLTNHYLTAAGQDLDSDLRHVVTEDLRTDPVVRRELNLAWFPISAEQLVADLYAKPHRLAAVATFLSQEQVDALYRPREAGWTVDDIPLLDEAMELLGPLDAGTTAQQSKREHEARVKYARQVLQSSGAGSGIVDAETLAERFAGPDYSGTTAERASHDRSWVYGHVVVDEAQELSEMAWHSLLRRCPTRSFTVVGDVAQTSAASGTRDWTARLRPIFRRHLRLETLSVNYRTPRTVCDLATEVGRELGLPVSALESPREVPDAVKIVRAGSGASLNAAFDAAIRELDERAEGTVALITKDPGLAAPWFAAHEADYRSAAGEPRLAVMSPAGAKGLEYDVVVVHEPAQILGGPGGASGLYVALSRPTQRLVVVHSEPLPPGFPR